MKRAFLFGVLSVLACATAATVLGTQSAGDEILFPHARHAQAKIECITCHETVYDAKTLTGDFLPPMAKCLECHKEKAENCAFCHSDVKSAAPWPKREPRLKFDHAAHIELVKEDCSKCHLQLSQPGQEAPPSGGHAACLSCHNHAQQYSDASCATCHVDLAAVPLRPLTEVSHEGDFLRRHSVVAKATGASCETCHDQNFCLDCHAKTAMVKVETKFADRPDRAFIHRNDFLGRHSVEARADPVSCQRCHSATYCETCHQESHVAAGSPNARNPHPPGWAFRGSGPFHGDAARRDILSCASCHDQGDQSNCIQCHKVGGIGGDPHPPGFSSQHSLRDAVRDGRCVVCHR
jgi:Cytochrome c7 and related cytochrome c